MILEECRDKSQLETIVIASIYNPLGVYIGTTCGFASCVILAILSGKLIGKYKTERMITFFWGAIFLLFTLQYLLIKFNVI